MKTSKSTLFAILVIAAAVLAAKNASAGGFNFGGGGGGGGGGNGNGGGNGGNKGGFKVTFGGGNHNHKFHNDHHGHHHYQHYNHVKYYTPRLVYSQCYHPQFRFCFVYPGDSWFTISRQMYGVDFLGRHVASYNGLSLYTQLVPGQQIRMPVVNTDGSLSVSGAPLPPPFLPQGIPMVAQGGPIGPQTTQFGPQASMVGPQGSPAGVANMQAPSAGVAPQGLPSGLNSGSIAPQGLPSGLNNGSIAPQGASIAPIQNAVSTPSSPTTSAKSAASIRTVKEEPTLPRVANGSTLVLDGQSLGNEKGIVRLRIGGMALPVEVIEWTASSVKIELPKMDLSRPVKADLEVLRADGSLASSSAIELSPAATRLALGN